MGSFTTQLNKAVALAQGRIDDVARTTVVLIAQQPLQHNKERNMNDAEYIAAIAEFYKDGPGPEFRAHYERLMHISAALAAPAQAVPEIDIYVWPVPDKCDRIVWRGAYHHLPIQKAAPAPARCKSCGTHEVSQQQTCHNSGCADYAQDVTIYEGWKSHTPASSDPVAVPAGMPEPAAWAATSEDGNVEALGMNQSRRFDTPLFTAAQVQAVQPGYALVPVQQVGTECPSCGALSVVEGCVCVDCYYVEQKTGELSTDYVQGFAHGQTTLAPPQPAAQAQEDAKDAARWRWIANYLIGDDCDMDDGIVACKTVSQLAVLADIAIATQQGTDAS